MSLREPVAVVGAGGMLGRAWRELLDRRGIEYRALDVGDIDVTDGDSVRRALSGPRGTVINCAAFTDVDGAEEREAEATAVNGEGVGHLARRCAELRATLVHYSTDYVFDGNASTPYGVDHPIEPVNAYGRSKAAGERLLREVGVRHLLVRTSWLYAPWGKNFVRTMVKLCRERDALRVVDDQRGRPTSAEHLALHTLQLLEADASGTYHLTDGGECTWHGLASEIARHVRPACVVEPCTSAEFPRPARRPAYSVLDLTRAETQLGPLPDWKQAVSDVLSRLESA